MEGVCCPISCTVSSSWVKHALDGCGLLALSGRRCKNPLFGSSFHGSSLAHDLCFPKVSVAADYSDSVPDSSDYVTKGGYHPLEELKPCRRRQDAKLSEAEMARTTVEAYSNALLVFPESVHSEPHEQISWAEFRYVIDDYGDIFFEIFDDENIIKDHGASNPVNALIGMDIPLYENKRIPGEYKISDINGVDDMSFDDDYFEVADFESSDVPVDWGMPDTSSWVHPVYFAKCMMKSIKMESERKMDHPSNGVSILGCLRPAFLDEESYLRRLFYFRDSDGYSSDCKDGEILSFSSSTDGSNVSSSLYRLAIMRIELFSVYGDQSSISLQDFQDAEPDALVHSISAIVENLSQRGILCNISLKALCKKKGLLVEEANLVGVDSLGMDVRVRYGSELQTHRFPFKVRATSEVAAGKQIEQLLFPRSHRKKITSQRKRNRNLHPS